MINKNFLLAMAIAAPHLAVAQVACESGSIEGDSGLCQTSYSGECELDAITNLETINPPSFLEGQVGGNGQLTLQVRHGLTASRTVDEIVLNEATAACNYPGPNWSKGVGAPDDECLDTYDSAVPWSVAGDDCGLVRSEDDDYVYMTGLAEVRMTEQLESLRGQSIERTIVAALEFRIGFQKEATIDTVDTIYDDPRLLSAITAQEWNSEDGYADLDVTMSLQKPFKVKSWSIDDAPDGITALEFDGGLTPTQDCSSQSGDEDCLQVWSATLTPDAETCFIAGSYSLTAVLDCQDNVADADCPFFGVAEDDASRLVSIELILDSENLCARVEELIGVNLQLDSHVSFDPLAFDFGPIKDAFFQEQEMYYDLRINAEENFDLQQTEIELCTVSDASGTDVVVYERSAGATPGWSWATLFNSASAPTAHQHEFEFVPAEPVFGVVPLDGSVDATVTVTVSIVFANTGARKRFTLQALQSQPAPADADISLNVGVLPAEAPQEAAGTDDADSQPPQPADDEETEGDGFDLEDVLVPVCIAIAALSCCCLMFVVLFSRRRRRDDLCEKCGEACKGGVVHT